MLVSNRTILSPFLMHDKHQLLPLLLTMAVVVVLVMLVLVTITLFLGIMVTFQLLSNSNSQALVIMTAVLVGHSSVNSSNKHTSRFICVTNSRVISTTTVAVVEVVEQVVVVEAPPNNSCTSSSSWAQAICHQKTQFSAYWRSYKWVVTSRWRVMVVVVMWSGDGGWMMVVWAVF